MFVCLWDKDGVEVRGGVSDGVEKGISFVALWKLNTDKRFSQWVRPGL